MKINLHEISDDLDSNWWHYIRSSSDFAFLAQIPDQKKVEVSEGDTLIHKQILEGDRFPSKVYHYILDGEPIEMDGKDVRDLFGETIAKFIKNSNQFPFGCKFKKIQKKDQKIVIDYNPNDFDNFQMKIAPELIFQNEKTEEGILEFMTQLPENLSNPLSSTDDPTFTIKPVDTNQIITQISTESGNATVCVFDGKITKIDLRKSFFQGSETIFYLLQIENGKAAPDTKKDTLRRDFSVINVKCSENAYEKYELNVGDVVSFKGKLKDDRKLKLVLQNIRKFEKS